ncbi:hypothetical protein Fmac_005187 [Flemingia macrophylla]|uniref:Transcription factor CBF/NF-Y/archaeal histone domain-containing protein n=1 Tax=Flemingia macrophylla TaxID=520843 RepID=A0ABD1N710_9FABA
MKKVLPANGKIAKDPKEIVQECVSEFMSFITNEGIPRARPQVVNHLLRKMFNQFQMLSLFALIHMSILIAHALKHIAMITALI